MDNCGHWLAGHALGVVEVVWNEADAQAHRDSGWTVEGPFVHHQPGAVSEAERGRSLVDRMFALERPSPEWEQALADLRVWSMEAWNPPTTRGAVDPSEAERLIRLLRQIADECMTDDEPDIAWIGTRAAMAVDRHRAKGAA